MFEYPHDDDLLAALERGVEMMRPRTLSGQRPEAGVLVAVTDNARHPEIVLTQRAAQMNSHAGEVALPGGKRDPEDRDLLATALREAEEEVSLPPDAVRVVGPLSQVVSKHGFLVTPYLGVIPETIRLSPSPDELDGLFRVPLRFFLEDRRHHTDRLSYKGKDIYVPSYRYEGYVIWGLTAYVIVELLNQGLGAEIPLRPRPEQS
ncbi:CoA pyrophosphatase [Motiliproteus sediminis]|uniref:CoA pyrophosphatase n=1 Tax=Motiliproteus sediminis TaxID=1468178 RepID=UPI001AEFAAFF|nr:CoA pyrophosphatase [Motiliproteus sediminis]